MYNWKVYEPEFELNVVKEYLNGDNSQGQICKRDKEGYWGSEECDQVKRVQQWACGRFSEQVESDKEDTLYGWSKFELLKAKVLLLEGAR